MPHRACSSAAGCIQLANTQSADTLLHHADEGAAAQSLLSEDDQEHGAPPSASAAPQHGALQRTNSHPVESAMRAINSSFGACAARIAACIQWMIGSSSAAKLTEEERERLHAVKNTMHATYDAGNPAHQVWCCARLSLCAAACASCVRDTIGRHVTCKRACTTSPG